MLLSAAWWTWKTATQHCCLQKVSLECGPHLTMRHFGTAPDIAVYMYFGQRDKWHDDTTLLSHACVAQV